MKDYNKYIGIPFKAHGRSLNGLDCFGLCREVLKNEFSQDLPEWIPSGDSATELMKKYNEQWNHLEKIESPVEGCVGLYCFEGLPIHMVLYIGEGKILHVMIDESAVIEKINSSRLQGRLYGWYHFR